MLDPLSLLILYLSISHPLKLLVELMNFFLFSTDQGRLFGSELDLLFLLTILVVVFLSLTLPVLIQFMKQPHRPTELLLQRLLQWLIEILRVLLAHVNLLLDRVYLGVQS